MVPPSTQMLSYKKWNSKHSKDILVWIPCRGSEWSKCIILPFSLQTDHVHGIIFNWQKFILHQFLSSENIYLAISHKSQKCKALCAASDHTVLNPPPPPLKKNRLCFLPLLMLSELFGLFLMNLQEKQNININRKRLGHVINSYRTTILLHVHYCTKEKNWVWNFT